MSQGSQGSFAPDRLTLSLSKFSYATAHCESVTPIPWIHLGRTDNLFAIFETKHLDDSRGQLQEVKKFRVLQDPQVLEDIDIDVLAREANRAKLQVPHSGWNGRPLSVMVVVKMPCIAIRYPLDGGQIRRIQLRFTSNDDYFEALKIFSRANVPIGNAGSFPTQQQPRPCSSSSSLLRPSDSASQIGVCNTSILSNVSDMNHVRVATSAEWPSEAPWRPTTSSGPAFEATSSNISNYLGERYSHVMDNKFNLPHTEGSLLHNPSNGLVSGYFAAPTTPHAVPLLSKSVLGVMTDNSPIDLYQPRPSTAPVIESQKLSQMLPPKRELPFSVSTTTKKAKKSLTQDGYCPTHEYETKTLPTSLPNTKEIKNRVLDAPSAMGTISQISTESIVNISPSSKKPSASKITKTRACKKQQVKETVKKALKAAEVEDDILSVEQLLDAAQMPMSQPQKTLNTIDTQSLLSRVEATSSSTSVGLPVLSGDQTARSSLSAPSSQIRKCQSCRLRKGKCSGGDPCEWCKDLDTKCTYAVAAEHDSQVQVPSSQPEVRPEAYSQPKQVVDQKLQDSTCGTETRAVERADETASAPQAEIAQQAAPQASSPPKDSTFHPVYTHGTPICGASTTTTALAAESARSDLHLSSTPDPLALLLCETPFAQCHELASWASLPESVQHSTLDTWMCQQLNDPAFIALVKRLDESWQANLFGKTVGVDL